MDQSTQDAALTHPNLICQQANALFAMGIALAIQSACDRKELYQHNPAVGSRHAC